MMTEIYTIDGDQKNVLPRRANIKKGLIIYKSINFDWSNGFATPIPPRFILSVPVYILIFFSDTPMANRPLPPIPNNK